MSNLPGLAGQAMAAGQLADQQYSPKPPESHQPGHGRTLSKAQFAAQGAKKAAGGTDGPVTGSDGATAPEAAASTAEGAVLAADLDVVALAAL